MHKTVFFPSQERGSFSCPLVGENPNPPYRAVPRLRVFLKTLFNCQAAFLQNAVIDLLRFLYLRYEHNGVFCERTGLFVACYFHCFRRFILSIHRLFSVLCQFQTKTVQFHPPGRFLHATKWRVFCNFFFKVVSVWASPTCICSTTFETICPRFKRYRLLRQFRYCFFDLFPV